MSCTLNNGLKKGGEVRMTNKEAIEIIAKYDVNGCGYCHQGGDEVLEAFNMAINALKKQEATEPKDMEAVEPEIRENGLSAYYNDIFRDVYCGECGASLRGFITQDKYCPRCGRMVKWD